jgi:hypothetical protein
MSGEFFDTHFTVAEANALIPFLKEHFEKIHRKQAELVRQFPEIKEFLERKSSDFGFANSIEYIQKGNEIGKLIDRISRTGVLLKDLQRGLVDFPHVSEGKQVFLCWELGEEEVKYWHEIEAGYVGRQPLYLDREEEHG